MNENQQIVEVEKIEADGKKFSAVIPLLLVMVILLGLLAFKVLSDPFFFMRILFNL